MRWIITCVLFLSTSQLFPAPVILGDYLEARSPASWTDGQSGIRTSGEVALLGWIIREGSWNGTDLKGLTVALALRARGSLSEGSPEGMRAVIYLDEMASEEQGDALISMARTLAGKFFQNVVATRRVRIIRDGTEEGALLKIGDGENGGIRARIQARVSAHHACDIQLEGESGVQPPLAGADHFQSAGNVEFTYRAPGLDLNPGHQEMQSALVGEFSL